MRRLFKCGFVYDTDTRSFEEKDVLTLDTKIEKIGKNIDCVPDETVDCTGKYLIPGLVDVHTHGRARHDFNTATKEDVLSMRMSYASRGTTTIMATLASSPIDEIFASCDAIKSNREVLPGKTTVAGCHIEGRYLNPSKRGAHPTELLAAPDGDELGRIIDLLDGMPTHVSAALELAGDDFYKAALSRGATLGIAHSDATYDEAMTALEKGAASFTHTFNAMRQMHHREPGNTAASLLSDAYSEVICDGMHVHPAMIEMLSRLKPDGKLVLITDSMEAAGCEDGEYSIAGLKVFVKDGKAVNVDGALAGSTLDLISAVGNYMKFCSKTLEEAIPCATSNPAKMVGIDGTCGALKEGLRADIIILNEKNPAAMTDVYAAGEKVLK